MTSTGEKICLVTGANSGIGKAAAYSLAMQEAEVILVARNHYRGERALKELVSASGNQKIHLFLADLSSLNSTYLLAKELKKKFTKLDVLINCAGVYFSKRHSTVDGFEATFAINYLSRFLLSNLLLELLLKSKQARIIDVSGEYHRQGKIDFLDLQKKNKYSGGEAVNQSKLANILFTYELARKLTGTSITVNTIHPGFVATNIIFNNPDAATFQKMLYRMITPFLAAPEESARALTKLSIAPEYKTVTGKYFNKNKMVSSSPQSYNEIIARKLWEISEKLIFEVGIKMDEIDLQQILKQHIEKK